MDKRLVFATSCVAAAMITSSAYAFEFGKPITTSVVVTKTNQGHSLAPSMPRKEVVLMNINLNPKERHLLMSYQPKKIHHLRENNNNLPSAMNLGMNNVPVLDQGYHGSCVTFAVTAAIDAALGKGDYISQLCHLELGAYLEDKGYMPSGWWGSLGPWVFDQIMRFGIVSKENQKSRSCANETEYPMFFSQGEPMSLGEFSRMSEDVSNVFYPVYHMNFIKRFDTHFTDSDEAEKVLVKMKQALVKGNRLTIGTFIVLSPYCSAGACANYKAAQDTWALTKDIENPPYGTGGHEMVVTGYDDKAVAIDSEGNRHQGLITLRNSWGDEVGNHGDYYMSYDYFKKFVGEVQELVTAN